MERSFAGTFRDWLRGPQAVIGLLASSLFVALRLWWASVPSLHPDEAFTLLAVRQPWDGLLQAVVQDVVHPPFFYALLKAWLLVVGENIFLLRLLPVAIAVLTILPVYLLCRELRFSPVGANLVVFFVAVNPFLVRSAQTLRMYSTLVLLGTCSLWLLLRYCREAGSSRKTLVALTCVNLLMVYTQYLGAILIFVEILVVFLDARPKLRSFLAANVLIALAFLPWGWLVLTGSRQRSGIVNDVEKLLGWTDSGDWRGLVAYFARLTGPNRSGLAFSKAKSLIGLMIFALPVGLAFRDTLRSPARPEPDGRLPSALSPLAWLAIFVAGPVAIAAAVSVALPISILGARYLILVVIPYLMLWAAGLDALKPTLLRRVAIVAAMVWALLGFREEVRLGERADWIRIAEDMRRAEPRGHETSEPLTRVYTLVSAKPIRYVLEKAGDRRFEILSRPNPAEFEGSRFWLAYQESYWKPATTRALLDELARRGYRLEKGFQSGAKDHRVHLDLFVRSTTEASEAPRREAPP